MTAVLVNGVNLGTRFGFYADRVTGWLGTATVATSSVTLRGRDGGMAVPAVGGEGRRIEVAGTLRAETVTARRDAERGVADLVRSGRVRLVVDDGLAGAMQIEGRLQAATFVPFGPSLSPLASRGTLAFVCEDEPYWRDVEPTTRAVAAVSTRYTVPLGTAPSSPIIRIMGSATNPVLTYRDAGGASVRSITFTATLTSSEYLDIDMRRGRVQRVTSGAAANGLSLITGGDFPWGLDPQDGDYGTSAWPTVEVSAGTAEILWWRQWL